MRVLLISNLYPINDDPSGSFIKNQKNELEKLGLEIVLRILKERSFIGYLIFYICNLGF